MKKEVRVGVIGVGGMGTSHLNYLLTKQGCKVTAVSEVDPSRLKAVREKGDFALYDNHKKLLEDKVCDAVIVATPHYLHTTIGIDALKAGLHLLVEKPISVHKRDCERLIEAYKKTRKRVFAAMFNQRTVPQNKKIKQLLDNKELGKLMRVNWIITTWFRSDAYYASGGWRATWAGEGGGVLLNQCPHQLDLLQWFCGMPSRVLAKCALGKYHKIEVEDDVTAMLEYPNGATGVFITSTGEAPGTNRLEITGTRGKLVYEDGKIDFVRNEVPCDKFCRTTKESFAAPDTWKVSVSAPGQVNEHAEIIDNFIDAINSGTKLIAPGEEGIRSVELGNAMLYSSLIGKPVDMPLNGAAFERELKKLIRNSKFVKKTKKKTATSSDLAKSFSG